MPSESSVHIPVLYQQVMDILQPSSGDRMLDGTVGAGGHAAGLLGAGASVLGLDRDTEALEAARRRLSAYGERVILRHASYRRAAEQLSGIGWHAVDGVLLDLGLSSMQLENAERGFAFLQDGPLDMRFDRSGGETAEDLVNTLPEEELARIISQYGEDRNAKRIASALVRSRPVKTTCQLADIASRAAGPRPKSHRSIHPATRTFQALRIAVNGELEELEAALASLVDCLSPGGRLAVISFHSLEDRLIKQFFRRAAGKRMEAGPALLHPIPNQQPVLRELTRKPISPDAEEISRNPRARSAKLRAAEKASHSEMGSSPVAQTGRSGA